MDSDMDFRQLMHKLHDGLYDENVAMIRYLCKDIIHFNREQHLNAIDILAKFEEKGFITKTDMTFLAEVLYRINRIDLLKLLPGVKNRRDYESHFMGSSSSYNFSAFRVACFRLIDQLTKSDFGHLKDLCKGKLCNRNYNKSACIISLLVCLEEEDLLSEGNLEFLTYCLSHLDNKTSHDMFTRLIEGDEESIFFPHGHSSPNSSHHSLSHSQSLISPSLSQAGYTSLNNSESHHSHSSPSLLQNHHLSHSLSLSATPSLSQTCNPYSYNSGNHFANQTMHTFPKLLNKKHEGSDAAFPTDSKFFLGPPTATNSSTRPFSEIDHSSQKPDSGRFLEANSHLHQSQSYQCYSGSEFSSRSGIHSFGQFPINPQFPSNNAFHGSARTEPRMQSNQQSNELYARLQSLNIQPQFVQPTVNVPVVRDNLQGQVPFSNTHSVNVQSLPTDPTTINCTPANHNLTETSSRSHMQPSELIQSLPFRPQVDFNDPNHLQELRHKFAVPQTHCGASPSYGNPRKALDATLCAVPQYTDVVDSRQRPPFEPRCIRKIDLASTSPKVNSRFVADMTIRPIQFQVESGHVQPTHIQPQHRAVCPSIDLSEEVLPDQQPDVSRTLPLRTNNHPVTNAGRSNAETVSFSSVCSKTRSNSQPSTSLSNSQARLISGHLPNTSAATLSVDNSTPTCSSTVETLECYPMNSTVAGICLIINNCNFEVARSASGCSDQLPNDRTGSKFDVEAISEVFHFFRFDVKVYEDLDAQSIEDLLKEIANISHKNYSCFVLFIMSHGGLDQRIGIYVYGVDGKKVRCVNINKIFKPSSCSTLKGKPKIIFYQACQTSCQNLITPSTNSDDLDQDGPDSWNLLNRKCPEDADFLICYSTVPGGTAFRSKSKGSFFISLIAKNLLKFYQKQDLLSIMVRVNNDLVNEGLGQVSMPVPTVRGKIFFTSHQPQEHDLSNTPQSTQFVTGT